MQQSIMTTVSFFYCKGLNWVPVTAHSGVPPNAVVAGRDVDGAQIFVGRAYHEGDTIPAKAIPSKNVAYVPYNGQEIAKSEWQMLTGHGFSWVTSGSGHVPPEAVVAGHQSNGEPLYVGRASINGALTTGKVHPSHNCIYVPFGGLEHSVHQYEVLIAPRRGKFIHINYRHSIKINAYNDSIL